MKNDLIGRYIYAVTFHLPKKIREDVERELDGLISDMLERRCNGAEPTESDIKAVLTELGTPEQLAAKYSGEEKLTLLSGMYFLVYKRVLSIVLPIAPTAAFIGNIISVLTQEKTDDLSVFLPKLIASAVGGALSAAAFAFTAITLIFVILERKKVIFNNGDILTSLPPVPRENARIPLSEPVGNIIWAMIAGILFLSCPYVIGYVIKDVGWVSAFNADIVRSMWFLVAFWVLCGIVLESVKLIDRSYTKRVAAATVICNTLTAVTMGFFFANDKLMNPSFIENASKLYGGTEFFIRILQNLNHLILGIGIVILIWGIVHAVYKAWRNIQG
jgi:hypothetical protein